MSFLSIYIPMFFNFIVSRLINQTDLIMVSDFGESAVAAFSVPSNIMFIDLLASFAITPIIAVRISKAATNGDSKKEIGLTLIVGLFLSFVLTIAGLALYPRILEQVVGNKDVQQLSLDFIFWMTLAIIPRFMLFVAGICLNSIQKSKWLVAISLLSLVGNYALNWLFMYFFNYGAIGCYIGTVVISFFALVISILVLKSEISFEGINFISILDWWKKEIKGMSIEILRLSSERGTIFLAFFLMNNISIHHEGFLSRLAIFSVASELFNLLSMPMIAIMRSVPIYLSYNKIINKKLVLIPLFSSVLFSLLIYIFSSDIGRFYNIDLFSNWWEAFCKLFLVFYTSLSIGSIARGYLYARKDFDKIFKFDVLIGWLVFLPIFFLGVYLNSPYLFWFSYSLQSLLGAFFLSRYSKEIQECFRFSS